MQHALTAATADVCKQIQPPNSLQALPQQRVPAAATPRLPAALKAEPMVATGVFKGLRAFTLPAAEQSLPSSRSQRQGSFQKPPPAVMAAVAAVVPVGEMYGPQQKQHGKSALADAAPASAKPSSSKVKFGGYC